ncbi:MAG: lipase maturation factor family protein [Candidatus Omnitrophica bacterium]|nr:lipase maturation factor family protein [Candidatus Omnitrophota bacterium]
MGCLYLIGFLVAAHQFCPLLGERGLLPVPHFLKYARFSSEPSIFFLHYSDRFALTAAWAGVFLSVMAATGFSERFGTPFSVTVWVLLWVLYLSIVNVGQIFYAFGWESMLLEAGFFAIFLGSSRTASPAVVIWILRWMLFRLMFGAGLIKLRGDSCWRDLTCLQYHYETQPIPNGLSWFFHQMPAWFHKGGVLVNHIVELAVPFGYFAPQPVCAIAGILTILFQGMLIVSGNFSWLNWLTIAIAFSCFNDGILGKALPVPIPDVQPRSPFYDAAVWGLAAVVVIMSIRPVLNMISPAQVMNRSFNPLHLVNTYGAFGSVTRQRYEIAIEGTSDEQITPQTEWKEYPFKGKPGSVDKRPPQIAPYHLRLDWLLWFAAMGSVRQYPWLLRLAERLLEGDPATLRLLAGNPFPDVPPKYIRMRYYLYRFTTPEERKATGHWWKRELKGEYLPPVALKDR